jgi:hypothetical protein
MAWDNNKNGIGQGEVISTTDTSAEVISEAMNVVGLRNLNLFVDHPVHATATAFIMSADISPDGVNWYPVQNQDDTTPPDRTMADGTRTRAVSGIDEWAFRMNENGGMFNGPWVRFRFTVTGGSAGDSLTMRAYGEALPIR